MAKDSPQRFKALGGNERSGLIAYVSPDGLRWSRLQEDAVLRGTEFDSQNVAFWSDHEQCYVCYMRSWTGDGYSGIRTVSRSTSTGGHTGAGEDHADDGGRDAQERR